MTVPFHNLTGGSEAEIASLRDSVLRCRDLAEVMAWAGERPGYRGRETFVNQDEFTHDGVFPVEGGRYVVFGLT
ncbi:hypothetical protein ABI59_19835 [Acidobacteria bacterium Mor1]|nr:hypothetical protein ABI59_19835 [Acidobacteria bacterium Mor1]